MQQFWLKQRVVLMVVMSMVVLPLNGCVYLVVGSVGALGGYVASPDTIEGTIVDRSYDTVWDTTVKVLSDMGMLETEYAQTGSIEARLQGTYVKATVLPVGMNSVQLSIKARRNFFPKISTAQEVYVKIVTDLGVDSWDVQG